MRPHPLALHARLVLAHASRAALARMRHAPAAETPPGACPKPRRSPPRCGHAARFLRRLARGRCARSDGSPRARRGGANGWARAATGESASHAGVRWGRRGELRCDTVRDRRGGRRGGGAVHVDARPDRDLSSNGDRLGGRDRGACGTHADGARALADALVAHEFPIERRTFEPHVTLARRCRRRCERATGAPIAWTVSRIVLNVVRTGTGRAPVSRARRLAAPWRRRVASADAFQRPRGLTGETMGSHGAMRPRPGGSRSGSSRP